MGPGHPRFEHQGRVGPGTRHVRHALRLRQRPWGDPRALPCALRSVRRRDDPLPAGCRCGAGMAVPRSRGGRRQHRPVARRPGGQRRSGARHRSRYALSRIAGRSRHRSAPARHRARPHARAGIRPRARAPAPRPPPRARARSGEDGRRPEAGRLAGLRGVRLAVDAGRPGAASGRARAEGAGRHAARHGLARREHPLRAEPGGADARPWPGRRSRRRTDGHVARGVRRGAAFSRQLRAAARRVAADRFADPGRAGR